MKLGLLLLGLALSSVALGKEICYGDLGCFRDTYPFSGSVQRPIALLPESPTRIDTKFYLYSRHINGSERISADFLGSYSPSLKTKLIVHGFLHFGSARWVTEMKDALLESEDLNVINVDWSRGNGFPYTQATANTQVVGAEIAKLIKTMHKEKGAKPADFHIIGHSLGSHIAGYAGERVIGLGQITGLDPAGPYFENTDTRVRLDPSDAKFVDVIHSDGEANLKLGLGLLQPIGHVDFYPNSGKNQPNCPKTSGKLLTGIFDIVTVDVQGIEDNLACSHMAACYFYTESIKNQCSFTSYPCSSWEDFTAGKCFTCGPNGCNRMGHKSTQNQDQGELLYLYTQPPLGDSLCQQTYQVSLSSNRVSGITQTRGKFTIYFETESGAKSSQEILSDSDETFKPNSVVVKQVNLKEELKSSESIKSLYISFDKTTNWLNSWMYDDEWSFRTVFVFHGQRQEGVTYCPTQERIKSGGTIRFDKC